MTGTEWDQHADWWQREFTDGADPEYDEQVIPLALGHLRDHGIGPGDLVVDVGTGEGQVARAIVADLEATVVGFDPSTRQIDEAAVRGAGPLAGRADAGALPLRTGCADAVLVCLVFEHVVDIDRAVAEVARVLEPGGRLALFINHPLIQTPGSAMIIDHATDPPETYWRIGPYLPEVEDVEEVQKGVFMRFQHRPLSRYINALADAGLTLVHMDEPAPPPGFIAKASAYEHEVVATTPRLAVLVADRTGAPLRSAGDEMRSTS